MSNDEPEKPIETFDEKQGVGILSGRAPTEYPSGPRRRAPMYYAGERYGRRRIQYPDVERYPNGAIPSKRNKLMRRMLRGALKRRFSAVERARKLPQAMLEQARLIAKENGKSSKWARQLFARELSIHQAAYVPADLRAERTRKRVEKRAGQKDAIAKLVDRMTEQKR